MTLLFHQEAVRVRAGTRTDRAGNTIPDWSPEAVDRLTLTRLNIAPRTTEENRDESGVRVTTGWWLQTAPGADADIASADRIEFDGLLCEVVGDVARWPDPFTGKVHHVKVALQRAT
ncbi:hypothetical protein AB0I72_00495 [Nocardiopsis sp. NPDC049922]|uniref:hypothetical protein n=1 Tax=Nocardiopsis sp. NPDC049922 TaxID=3155157 RepID=UPI003404F00A